MNNAGDPARQQRRYGIPDLMKLLGAVALEEVVVRKRLQPCGFADRQAAALSRIRMDEIVAVLGNVTGNGCRRPAPQLNPEAVCELS